MIDHIWSVLCSKSIINQDNNSISLIDVLEQMTILSKPEPGARIIPIFQPQDPEKPAIIPMTFELVSFWSRSEPEIAARGEQRITLYSPSGVAKEVSSSPLDLETHHNLRTRALFAGFPLDQSGRYVFSVEFKTNNHDWREVARIPFLINSAEESMAIPS